MSRSTTRYIIRLFVLIVSMVFVGADLSVSAQNANSSTTTMQEGMSMQNSNTSNTNMNRGGRRRRRGRRSGRTTTTNDAATGETPEPTNVLVTDRPVVLPVQTGRCDPNAQEQTDLSGTYTGTANYTEGGLSGEATLTINGNDFTMTSGSTTQEGRISAVTTCNYTAVTMMFGKTQATAASSTQPAPVPIVSLRARKVAGGLILESVGGGSAQFSFSSAPASGGARKRGSRGNRMDAPIPVGIKPPTR